MSNNIKYPIKVWAVNDSYGYGPDTRGAISEVSFDGPPFGDTSHKIDGDFFIERIDNYDYDSIYKYYLDYGKARARAIELTRKALVSSIEITNALKSRLAILENQ